MLRRLISFSPLFLLCACFGGESITPAPVESVKSTQLAPMEDVAEDDDNGSGEDVRNVIWLLDDINNSGVADGPAVTLKLTDDGHLQGNSGCNSYSGGYKMDGDNSSGTLSVSDDIMGTMMACIDHNRMSQEGQYLAILKSAKAYKIDSDGSLMINTPDGRGMAFRRK